MVTPVSHCWLIVFLFNGDIAVVSWRTAELGGDRSPLIFLGVVSFVSATGYREPNYLMGSWLAIAIKGRFFKKTLCVLGPAGFWRPENVPKVVILVFFGLVYVHERMKTGQTALEATLNEVEHALV